MPFWPRIVFPHVDLGEKAAEQGYQRHEEECRSVAPRLEAAAIGEHEGEERDRHRDYRSHDEGEDEGSGIIVQRGGVIRERRVRGQPVGFDAPEADDEEVDDGCDEKQQVNRARRASSAPCARRAGVSMRRRSTMAASLFFGRGINHNGQAVAPVREPGRATLMTRPVIPRGLGLSPEI